jgi:hypothetical protein
MSVKAVGRGCQEPLPGTKLKEGKLKCATPCSYPRPTGTRLPPKDVRPGHRRRVRVHTPWLPGPPRWQSTEGLRFSDSLAVAPAAPARNSSDANQSRAPAARVVAAWEGTPAGSMDVPSDAGVRRPGSYAARAGSLPSEEPVTPPNSPWPPSGTRRSTGSASLLSSHVGLQFPRAGSVTSVTQVSLEFCGKC